MCKGTKAGSGVKPVILKLPGGRPGAGAIDYLPFQIRSQRIINYKT